MTSPRTAPADGEDRGWPVNVTDREAIRREARAVRRWWLEHLGWMLVYMVALAVVSLYVTNVFWRKH